MYSDMNRYYRKPTVNPAFKLRQPLPLLSVILPGKDLGRPGVSVTGLHVKPAPSSQKRVGGGMNALCKDFAFSNLF